MTNNNLYLQSYWASVKELIRIGLRNKWITEEDLVKLIKAETEE